MVVVLLLLVVLVGYQAFRTALALRSAQVDAEHLRTQLSARDVPGATRTGRALADDGRTARAHTDNLLWDALGTLPWVGDDVHAVQVVSAVLDDAAGHGLPPALAAYDAVGSAQLRTADGRFDLATIKQLAPSLQRVSTVFSRSEAQVRTLQPAGLVGPLRGPVRTLQDQLEQASGTTRAGAVATRLLPGMLGADGPRTYLLVVQNNAEVRATGGLPGALSILRVRDGKVSLGTQLSTADFSVDKTPALPLTSQERTLYGEKLGTDLRDMNLTPDFPRAAALFRAEVARTQGTRVDGVVAVDPVALSAVLRATGPVQIGQETFSADNVVSKVLNQTYFRFPEPQQQDAYFATVARGIFQRLVGRAGNETALLSGVSEAAGQRRLLVWSDQASEQRLLAGTAVAGALPRDAAGPQVGMYLNDATMAKLDYYLDYTADLTSRGCTAQGSQDLLARMTLRSSVPRGGAGLPAYVLGPGTVARNGVNRVNLRLYAPAGARLTGLSVNGAAQRITINPFEDRRVASIPLRVRPGEKVEVLVSLRTRAHDEQDAVLQLTPGIRSQPSQVVARSSCG